MQRKWRQELGLPVVLKALSDKLRAWNKFTFGNIFERKKRSELRLGGVQRAVARRENRFLINLERELKAERSLILLQEEFLWRQKSRNEWLKSEDRNTKFFHTSTLVRRRNRVESLMDMDGRWVEDKVMLKNMAFGYNSSLFSADPNSTGAFIAGLFPELGHRQRETWEKPWSMTELKKELSEMGSWKAPGPDGYQPRFYKTT